MKQMQNIKNKSLGSNLILAIITMSFLFVDSILTLLQIRKEGVLKKQVLSEKSNIGFDVKIIMK